jgi:hypothetical protein
MAAIVLIGFFVSIRTFDSSFSGVTSSLCICLLKIYKFLVPAVAM